MKLSDFEEKLKKMVENLENVKKEMKEKNEVTKKLQKKVVKLNKFKFSHQNMGLVFNLLISKNSFIKKFNKLSKKVKFLKIYKYVQMVSDF